MRLPRIIVREPRPGRIHPVTRSDIEALLTAMDPVCFYGVRTIELARGEGLGRFEAPGFVRIFDVPPSPWRLRLSPWEASRLRRAGAEVQGDTVAWPGTTLRDFFLRDVLLHELGHHVLQHHAGKRRARIARTRDHEAFAELFAARVRRELES